MMYFKILCPAWYLSAVMMMFCFGIADSRECYTAAVYEHNRQGDEMMHLGDDVSSAVIKTNLHYYHKACEAASAQGADIIVFPEYGIVPLLNRISIKPYLEKIPNPKKIKVNPCDEAELFTDRPILYTLSCMAKTNRINLVANMPGIESCKSSAECPRDGVLHQNANVAFDKNGNLIGRYYKERLYYEIGMDLPNEVQDPVFITDVGKFAMFACFDIIFEKMSTFSQLDGIDAVLFPSMWGNNSPFYITTQWYQAWAIGNNATLLAANIQMPGYLATGSGIFMGRKGSIGHTINPDGISKLVVAKVPKQNKSTSSFNITAIYKNRSEIWKGNNKDVPDICSYSILGQAKNIQTDYRCSNENVGNYTLKKLRKTEDHLEVCNNKMCCELDYVSNGMSESYYLGVYNGTNSPFTRYYWWEENCFVARCDDINGSCSTFPMAASTLFYEMHLRANFTSKNIYPSFVSDKMKLVPTENWIFYSKQEWSSITMVNKKGIQVLAATLKGRAYEKDPPYIR